MHARKRCLKEPSGASTSARPAKAPALVPAVGVAVTVTAVAVGGSVGEVTWASPPGGIVTLIDDGKPAACACGPRAAPAPGADTTAATRATATQDNPGQSRNLFTAPGSLHIRADAGAQMPQAPLCD